MERNELTLDIQNLEKTYKGNVEAVCGIDVKLEKQRIYALLGPNGAGKTTVLKSILGLINYSGSILVLGRPVDEVREMISFVPEEKNLYENLNIEETLKLIRRISADSMKTRRASISHTTNFPVQRKLEPSQTA